MTDVSTESTPIGRHADPSPRPVSTEDLTRVVLRPLASPLPLAFFALGIASFLIAMQQAGIIPMDEQKTLYLMLAIFVSPAQITAAIICFQTREPLVAAGIGLISLTWPATAAATYLTPAAEGIPKTLGFLYISVATCLLLIAVPAVLAKPLLAIVITVASARYILIGIYDLDGGNNVQDAAAIGGFVVAGMCAYAAVALGLEDVLHKTVLPTLRRGEALAAFNGDLGFQTRSVATEAGVRRQL